jgi:3-oxoacyl-[acyl-carrier protein] reductase
MSLKTWEAYAMRYATVRAYVAVYGRAIAAAARERADSRHDSRPWGEYWVLADTPDPDILVANPGVRQTPADFRTLPRAEWQGWLDVHFSHPRPDPRGSAGHDERRLLGRQHLGQLHQVPRVGFAHNHAARLALSRRSPRWPRADPHNDDQQRLPGAVRPTLRTNLHAHAARRTTYESSPTGCANIPPDGRRSQECGDCAAPEPDSCPAEHRQ